jgi:hypothetical protein
MGSAGNRRGPPGPQGPQGEPGPQGEQGPQGEAGAHAPFAIFADVVLDNAGEAIVSLPANAARAFALAQGAQAYVVRVLDVDGSNVTVQVRRATTPSLGHNAPTFTGTPLGNHTHTIALGESTGLETVVRFTGQGGQLVAGVGGFSGITGVQNASAGTPAGTVSAPTAHPATALPLAAGDTVDLLVFYEAA